MVACVCVMMVVIVLCLPLFQNRDTFVHCLSHRVSNLDPLRSFAGLTLSFRVLWEIVKCSSLLGVQTFGMDKFVRVVHIAIGCCRQCGI